MLKNCLLFLFIHLSFFSCHSKNTANEPSLVHRATLEKLDSIQINYLGTPVVHDIDPLSKRVLFMENNAYSRNEEIFVADFDGNILASYIKDGDTKDTYGQIMAPLVLDGEGSFMAYAFNGFMRYDFEGNLISQVKIINFEGPGSTRIIGMGSGLQKSGGQYIYRGIGRNFDYETKDFFDDYYAMSLLDPLTGNRESIIPLPESGIFRQGKFFFSEAWLPAYYAEDDGLYIVFGLEPVIYVYENQHPFSLLSSIPMELPKYHYFKGASEYNNQDVRFFGHRRSSGRIHNIKKIKDYFVIAYFPGFDASDREESFSSNRSPDFWERMREKYPLRIAVLDSQGKVINDFVPEGLVATSMLGRNGELWMMGNANGEVELDYFQIFKVGLKVGE